jgi:BirA family biotin operon repressor/biotin-[acetyl-CoA-carboxylase] ligase
MTTDPLLEALRAAGDGHRSGAALARDLGLTRSAVHKRMEKLRGAGYVIEGTHRLGYRLVAGGLGGDGRAASASSTPSFRGWGAPLVRFAAVGSTQDEAKQRALAGAPEGLVVVADRQTSGRGRLGRAWSSPQGGLWFSLILRPSLAPDAAPTVALAAALDWARVLRDSGVAAEVKWPNDVWVGGRKVAGVLTEMSAEIGRVHWLVLGVGVNVNNAPPRATRVPATSLRRCTGRAWDLASLLDRWLAAFASTYAELQRHGFAVLREAFERHSLLNGRTVEAQGPDGSRRGRVLGVDEAGRLRVRTANGESRWSAGEVCLLG